MSWLRTTPMFLLISCSGSAAPPAAPTSPLPAEKSPSETAAREPAQRHEVIAQPAEASAEASTESAEPKTAQEQPSACPSDMVLVEGEYCSRVEQTCLQSWYDESNKKTVCEVFDPKTVCVGEKEQKRFCIDKYAWPNRAGERPEVMNRFNQAQVKCAAIGKRLCTESEWTFACEGPESKPFPYGYVRDTRKCNGDHLWDSPDMEKVRQRDPDELARLWKGVPSGTQPYCVSDFGVADLPGNNDEVVASETFDSGWRGKFDSVHTGGPWYRGVRNQCRPKIYTHDEGFYYYFLGFRCCAQPDREATDPRTPKQRKNDWTMERVERIAGFTREEVREALQRKATDGNCGCDELKSGKAKTRCKTICGTLLGPDARDAEQPPAKGLPPFGAKDRATPEQIEKAFKAGSTRIKAP